MDINKLLTFTKESGASDLHLNAGSVPMIRIDGNMKKITIPGVDVLPDELVRKMLFSIMSEDQVKAFNEDLESDFGHEIEGVARYRANVFLQRHGVAGVFRVIPNTLLEFDILGLPEQTKELIHAERGLVVVTGPTGSGKSTTLASIIDQINQQRAAHIITVEDPIEFAHDSKMSLVSQREVGSNTQSFSNALRAALREDPDVILVGEMRDLETVSLAITAAETGHLVFGTLHTNSAAKTIDRIINVFPTTEQNQIRMMLSESLIGVIAQALLVRAEGKGRIGAYEVMRGTPSIRNMVREGKTFQIPSDIQTGRQFGMQTLSQHLKELVEAGKVTAKEAARFDPELAKQ